MALPRPALATAGLLALAGCVGAPVRPDFACPARGGPSWHDVGSPHFVVRTDLDVAAATALLRRLERIRAAVLAVLFDESPRSEAGVEVVVFRSEATFRAFAPPGVNAYYLRSSGGPPRIVLSGDLDGGQQAKLAHELAHHVLSTVFLRQPRWFAEGLATQLEALGEPGPGGLLRVGLPPPGRLERVRRAAHRVPTRELLAWDGGPSPTHQPLDFYASAWLLVHFLAYREPAGFGDLQRRLIAGEPPDQAWRAAFPAWSPDQARALEGLDGLLVHYAAEEVTARFREIGTPWEGLPEVREIPPPEVHALRLTLWAQGPDKGVAALRAEVAETLREDPDHPLALQERAVLDGLDPLPLARRAVAGHPADARAWTFLGFSLARNATAEREAAFRRAAELADGNAAALNNLARELLDQGRSGEALPFSRAAVHLAPWSPPILAGHAAVLADLGRCSEAIQMQERALEVLPERSGEQAQRALSGRLREYLSRCHEPVAP